jgi:NADH-quinone oxidoreductase subunit M
MTEIGGLWNRLPVLAFFLILASLASAALPGLNGFVGEFPILIGSFAASPRAAVLAAVGTVIGTAYLLVMLKNMVFGPLHEPAPAAGADSVATVAPSTVDGSGSDQVPSRVLIGPITWFEMAGVAPLMVLIVAFGVFPGLVFDQVRPAVASVTEVIQAHRMHAVQPFRPSPTPAVPKKAAGAVRKKR